MKWTKRTALVLIPISLTGWSGISFAYRPFDATDAAVADVGQLEVELGPVGFRRSDVERTVVAPAYVLNFGFVKNWELVLEGRGEQRSQPSRVLEMVGRRRRCSGGESKQKTSPAGQLHKPL